jgi:hypothetical protein
MLGIYTLLPLLKGWEYKIHQIRRNVNRGAVEEIRISELGWLLQIGVVTDDALGKFRIAWQGADLETKEFAFTPEDFRFWGSFVQDPSGWLPIYFRPNPNSTAGVYSVGFSMYAEGGTLPYVPTITMEISLKAESTQSSAFISASAITIAITNREAFIRSLRRVLDAKADLWIDPALLALGLTEFKEEKK